MDAISEGKRRGLSRLQMIRGVKQLEKAGRMIWIKRAKDQRAVWALKNHESEAKKMAKLVPGVIPIELRIRHTGELKREVIKPWIEQLPTISIEGIFSPISVFPSPPFEKDSKLEVEGRDLFSDLKNHPCFKPNPFERLELFKRKVGEFWEKREEMLAEIDVLVEKEIGLPVCEKWKSSICDFVHRNLSRKILRGALYLVEGYEKAFSEELEFKSEMIPTGNVLEYWIVGSGCARVCGEEGERENLRTEYDNKVKGMMREMKKDPYKGKATEIVRVIHELERLKGEIKSVLGKYLRMTVFLGDCEYYPQMWG